MANWIMRRAAFWKAALYTKVRASMGILILAATVLMILRDGILDPQYRDRFLLKYVPQLDWRWWLVIGVLSLAVLALEGAYNVHRDGVKRITGKHRQRIRDLRHAAKLEEIGSNTKRLLVVENKESLGEPLEASRALNETRLPVIRKIIRVHGTVKSNNLFGAILWKSNVEIKAKRIGTHTVFLDRTNEFGIYSITVSPPDVYLFSVGAHKTELVDLSEDEGDVRKDFFI